MQTAYFKTSDEAYIYYEDTQNGENTIVLVPGHMCTTKFFKKNVDALKEKFRVITFDNRGFGNSSKPLHGNSIKRHAQDISELLEFLDVKNVTVLGWSLSASIVVTYEHLYKNDRLMAIGIIDGCLFPFSDEKWNTYNSRNYNMDDWNNKYKLWHMDIEQYVENFTSRMSENLSLDEVKMIKDEIVKTPPWIGFALHSDWCHTDATKFLPKISVPVVIFSGVSKGHGYEMGRYYKETIPTYTELHEFSEGGHLLFYVEHEKFNSLLENFINKNKL